MSIRMKIIGNDTKAGEIINRTYLSKRSHYVEVGPENIVLPGRFEQFYERINNFEVYDDDVFILAFPKTGSRWTQEMVWLLLNNLDFKRATEIRLDFRSPLLELESLFESLTLEYHFDKVTKLKKPRCIRSHLHWTLLPKSITNGTKQPKIIVVLRNPEDTCTSYFHQASIVEGYTGTWDEFCTLFLEGKVPFGPYWKHVLGLWEQRHRPNIKFINYSDMKTDLPETVKGLATFLGKELSETDTERLCNHLSFDNLKQSKGFNMEDIVHREKEVETNPYIRNGKIGDHKNVMSSEVTEAFKKQREKFLTGTGLNLD